MDEVSGLPYMNQSSVVGRYNTEITEQSAYIKSSYIRRIFTSILVRVSCLHISSLKD
jgi:hypothetical protein